MRVHIVGAGSIGSLIAWNLRKAVPSDHTLPISLLVKNSLFNRIPFHKHAKVTLQTAGADRPISRFDLEVVRGEDEGSGGSSIDIGTKKVLEDEKTFEGHRNNALSNARPYGSIQSLIVTTKAHQVPLAIQPLLDSNRLSPSSTIVLLTNGIGIYEHLISTLFTDPATRPHFILGTTTHGATAIGTLHFAHRGHGDLHYGVVPDPIGREHPYTSPSSSSTAVEPGKESPFYSLHHTLRTLNLLAAPLSASQEPIHTLQLRTLRKLVVNCCVNPLTAIHSVPNGKLLDNPEWVKQMKLVCEEAGEIFLRMAEQEGNDGVVGDAEGSALAMGIRRPFSGEDLMDAVVCTIKTTKENISSMLQDTRRGNVTEIDYLNGYLSRLGRVYGVETPMNDLLAEQVSILGERPKSQT